MNEMDMNHMKPFPLLLNVGDTFTVLNTYLKINGSQSANTKKQPPQTDRSEIKRQILIFTLHVKTLINIGFF
jgi:hypothetical protein